MFFLSDSVSFSSTNGQTLSYQDTLSGEEHDWKYEDLFNEKWIQIRCKTRTNNGAFWSLMKSCSCSCPIHSLCILIIFSLSLFHTSSLVHSLDQQLLRFIHADTVCLYHSHTKTNTFLHCCITKSHGSRHTGHGSSKNMIVRGSRGSCPSMFQICFARSSWIQFIFQLRL